MATVDYESKPYARWLEDVLPNMIELDPYSIGLVVLLPDGTTGTAYYNADNQDRALMMQAIEEDNLLEWVKINSDLIADIISGEEEGDDE